MARRLSTSRTEHVYSIELNMRSGSTQTAREAIVACALARFGAHGIDATSLREVAKDAGVSPALVVHHFGGRDGLVAAVDETALRAFGDAWTAAPPAEGPPLLRQRAEQTARVMRERPDVCAYLGRALVEGTPGSVRLFRLMVEAGRAEIDLLAERGALRPDADRLWATLQHFFLIWAPLSFMPLLHRTALDGGSLLDEATLARWVEANVALLRGGLYRDDS
jgi:TetR/AcrR family transcriptional regulator, regulator of cefoperazone and chloramphenicol sensitivity